MGARRRAVSAEVQKATAEMTAITQETLSISGIMLSKLFGQQDQEIERFHEQNQQLSELIIQRQMTGQTFWAMMQTFFSVSPIIIYVLAAYMISGIGRDGISAGTIIAFTTLQARLYFPIGTLLRVSVELQSSLALFERIFAYLDIKPEISDAPSKTCELPPPIIPCRERVGLISSVRSILILCCYFPSGCPMTWDAPRARPDTFSTT